MARMQPDGKAELQWGSASNADTTTGQTGATPTPPQPPKDSTSASVAGHPSSACGDNPRRDATVADWLRGTALALGVDLAQGSQPEVFAQKQGYLVRLSNEQRDAEVWPVTIPSAEEQAAGRAANLAEAKARIAGITARLALAHPALHPVIELHEPDVDSWGTGCLGCDAGAYAQDTPEWPCRTIELILEGLDAQG